MSSLFSPPVIARWVYPGLRWQFPAGEKRIFLTFDDGPHPDITPMLLQLLNQFHARGTFFCLGEAVEKNPALFHEILAQGHQVGNHSYNHPDGFITSTRKYLNNIEQASALIPSPLFRPPYGRILPCQLYELKKRYQLVMWNVMSMDYDPGLSMDKIHRHLLAATGDGSIVVFHDNAKTLGRLETILSGFLEHFAGLGFHFPVIPFDYPEN